MLKCYQLFSIDKQLAKLIFIKSLFDVQWVQTNTLYVNSSGRGIIKDIVHSTEMKKFSVS